MSWMDVLRVIVLMSFATICLTWLIVGMYISAVDTAKKRSKIGTINIGGQPFSAHKGDS